MPGFDLTTRPTTGCLCFVNKYLVTALRSFTGRVHVGLRPWYGISLLTAFVFPNPFMSTPHKPEV
jgi:hypothetical protein